MKIKMTSGRRGNSTKPLSMDSSSTYQFGELQPLMCMEMEADSSVTAFVRSIVRLGVLNVPTFGRMKYRIDGRFIPMADIYRPFENFLEGVTFASSSKSYVPTTVPVISIGALSAYLLGISDLTIYKKNEDIADYDEWTLQRGPTNNPRYLSYGPRLLEAFLNTFYYNFAYEGGEDETEKINYFQNINRTTFSQFASDEYVPSPYGDPEDTSLLQWIAVTPASADFMYQVNLMNGGQEENYLLCFRLNNDARRLYKIFTGLGWQFDLSNRDTISILPLLAFYKAQFDLYRPKILTSSPMTYDQTPAHRLQEYITDMDYVYLDYTLYDEETASTENIRSLMISFLVDLSVSTYFEETDYITSHLAKPSTQLIPISPQMSQPSTLATSVKSTVPKESLPTLNSSGNITHDQSTAWNVRMLLKLLPYVNKNTIVGGNIEKWLKVHGYGDLIQNSKSYAAGRYELPCRISDIDSVADTYNESSEEGELLGAYTGKGLGYTDANSPGTFKYSTNTPGYFILIATIIPMSRVSQGINPMLFHRHKLEFFDSAFDSLDFQISRKSLVCGRREIDKGTYSEDSAAKSSPAQGSFGFIPRYSEYCYLPNVLNGGLSLRSNRASFISYTLDKYYENVQSYLKPLNNTDWRCDLNVDYVVPIANPQLRNIANPLNGNFNRIFSRSQIVGGTRSDKIDQYNYDDDKFIVHNAIDVKYSSAKKPLGLSFETEDEGIDLTVDKE